MPAIRPDGHGILFQRSNVRIAVPVPGQATPHYQSRVQQIAPDGSNRMFQSWMTLATRVRHPTARASPSSDPAHTVSASIRVLSDGSETAIVAPDWLLALAYPRFSPDGQQPAFAAISVLAPSGRTGGWESARWLGSGTAMAHGFPWEVWLVNY